MAEDYQGIQCLTTPNKPYSYAKGMISRQRKKKFTFSPVVPIRRGYHYGFELLTILVKFQTPNPHWKMKSYPGIEASSFKGLPNSQLPWDPNF